MGLIGCVRCEKFRRDFVARTFAQFSPFLTECCNATNYPKCTQIVWNLTKQEVRVQWGGSSGLLWKIPTRLHGMNFCTTSARFASSFVRQPNGPDCIQIVQYTPKHEFKVQCGGSVAFVAKNSDATSWHGLFHQVGPFCTEFCNATERCQLLKNSIKHYETWVLGSMGWMGTFAVKNSDTT